MVHSHCQRMRPGQIQITSTHNQCESVLPSVSLQKQHHNNLPQAFLISLGIGLSAGWCKHTIRYTTDYVTCSLGK